MTSILVIKLLDKEEKMIKEEKNKEHYNNKKRENQQMYIIIILCILQNYSCRNGRLVPRMQAILKSLFY